MGDQHGPVRDAVLVARDGTAFSRTGTGLDVQVQDPHTQLLNAYLHTGDITLTLAEPAVMGERFIVVASAAGITQGKIICMQSAESIYQGLVLSVAGTTVNLDTPLNRNFAVTDQVRCGTYNINADGSVTPVVYSLRPVGAIAWDVYALTVYMENTAVMYDNNFAGLTALTKGIVLRTRNTHYVNLFNAKTTGDIASMAPFSAYPDKVPSGLYTFRARIDFRNDRGVTIRLDPARDERLELLVQDNLSTLPQFNVMVQGHFVEGN